MKIVGLTGGIASGKSTVSKILTDYGIDVVDADKISRELLNSNKDALLKIKSNFGDNIFDGDVLNRKKLGEIVFSSKDKLKLLESITHPLIRQSILEEIEAIKSTNKKVLILDAPLLIESGLYKICDIVWLITVDEDIQISRVTKRDDVTPEYALKIVKNQMSFEEKKEKSDIIINNSSSLDDLKKKIKKLIDTLQ